VQILGSSEDAGIVVGDCVGFGRLVIQLDCWPEIPIKLIVSLIKVSEF
jgi:hypothetical protein